MPTGSIFNSLLHIISKEVSESYYLSHYSSSKVSLSMFPTIDKMTNRHLKENFDGKCIIVVVGVRERKG